MASIQLRLRDDPQARVLLEKAVGTQIGYQLYQLGQDIPDARRRLAWYEAFLEYLATGSPAPLQEQTQYKIHPVDMRTFLYDPYYMGVPQNELWPALVDSLEEINSGDYIEAVLTGGIGVGKTTLALYTQAYQLYLLSCYVNPHRVLGIAETDEILFVFQNMSATLSKVVDYERFKSMIERSYYFMHEFPFNKDVSSELRFPNRITVKPVSGQITATIGQNVFSGVLDEVNFMAVVEKSKATKDGGTFDQARAIYNSISTRRKSRFLQQGYLPGVLCIVSSRNYPGQFTDVKEEEARREIDQYGKTSIYVYDKRLWELVPQKFRGGYFQVFVGDATRKARILHKEEVVAEHEQHLVIPVPEEFRNDFERDLLASLRDIAGVATLARYPFIIEVGSVSKAMETDNKGLLDIDRADFVETFPRPDKKRLVNPNEPRYCHIDLGLTSDSAGVVLGHVKGFKKIERGSTYELMPDIYVDMVLEVAPPRGGEIQFFKIRDLLYHLRDKLEMPIRWVSFDSYQSADSIQVLAQAGFRSGRLSMDTSNLPHEMLKAALYDQRISIQPHAKLRGELVSLEQDPRTRKVDHPPSGSKDCADALAGVVYGLTMRREIWIKHGVFHLVPRTIAAEVKE